jgi:hypothetical protein
MSVVYICMYSIQRTNRNTHLFCESGVESSLFIIHYRDIAVFVKRIVISYTY